MSARSFRSRSASETLALGCALGRVLGEASGGGLVIALDGPLGAGKTVFVKGLAEGLGVAAEYVSSPTFVIAQRYEGPTLRLHHIDLYRIDDETELDGFGFYELLDPPDIAAIEWSSRFPQALPSDRLQVSIARSETGEADERVLDVSAGGRLSGVALDGWLAQIEPGDRQP